jgi:hypothetical protein
VQGSTEQPQDLSSALTAPIPEEPAGTKPQDSGKSDSEAGLSDSDAGCWGSDEDFTTLASTFAMDSGPADSEGDDDEEVDDFDWDDENPILNDAELEGRLYTYTVQTDDSLDPEADWIPLEYLRRVKRQKKEHKGRHYFFLLTVGWLNSFIARGKEYQKGPGHAGKAARTLRHPKWQESLRGQQTLALNAGSWNFQPLDMNSVNNPSAAGPSSHPPTASKRGKVQKMTNRRGEPKGLQTVLKERGWDTKKFKRAKCKPVCPFESQNCCMARVLSQQDDFVNQPSMLESLIKERGHLCIFLPKFHCELNPIEMYWGWCKYRYRQTSKKTFAEAKENALEYLDACPTDVIRRFIQRSWRFMSVYRLGLTGNIAAWAVRKQKSHRACNESILAEIDKVDFSRK